MIHLKKISVNELLHLFSMNGIKCNEFGDCCSATPEYMFYDGEYVPVQRLAAATLCDIPPSAKVYSDCAGLHSICKRPDCCAVDHLNVALSPYAYPWLHL